jgi:hypothetical protein
VPAEVEQTAAPSSPHVEVLEQVEAAAFEHTEVKETKKPDKKRSEYLGATKKGK